MEAGGFVCLPLVDVKWFQQNSGAEDLSLNPFIVQLKILELFFLTA